MQKNLPITIQGYEKLNNELNHLIRVERENLKKTISEARALGDLKENGYYHASKQRLTFLDSRIRRVDRLIKLGIIVESHGNTSIQIGNIVTITDGTNTYTYTVVGGYESDPKLKTISHISPIGKALIGKKTGDVAEVISCTTADQHNRK